MTIILKDYEFNTHDNLASGESYCYLLSLRSALIIELKQLIDRLECLGTSGSLSDYDHGELKGQIDFLTRLTEPTIKELKSE